MRHCGYAHTSAWQDRSRTLAFDPEATGFDFEQIIELLSNLTTSVQETEPGVFSFHLYKEFDSESDQEKLILVEK